MQERGNNSREEREEAGLAENGAETRKFVPGVGRANFSQRVKSLENHFHVVNTSRKRVPCTGRLYTYRRGQRGWETVIGRQDIGFDRLSRRSTRASYERATPGR